MKEITSAKEKMEKRRHHPLSASKLQYAEACPGFRGEDTQSEASLAGTLQHAAMESGSDEGLDDDQILAVAKCRAFVESKREQLEAQWNGISEQIEEAYVSVDERKVTDETGYVWKGSSGGSFDLAFISADKTEAYLIDYKFGKHPVEDTSNNLQGIVYTLGLKHRIPTLKRIGVAFVMPYLDTVDEHWFDEASFQKLLLRVQTVVDRALNPSAPRRAAEGLCIWCANRGTCPQVAELALQVAKKFAPLAVPDNISPDFVSDPEIAGIGIKLADLIKKWAESYRAACSSRAVEDPRFIPDGYDLRHVVDREVANTTLLKKVAAQFGITAKEFDSLLEVGVTKVTKLISAKAPKGEKKEALKKFDEAARSAGAVVDGNEKIFLAMKRKGVSDEE